MKRLVRQGILAAGLIQSGFACAATLDGATTAVPLVEILRLAEARTGVNFVIPPCLATTPVARPIPSVLTPASMAELLDGYNYGAIWSDQGRLVKVVVSGRIDAPDAVCADDAGTHVDTDGPSPWHRAGAQLFRYEPMPAELPERYRQLPPGSVSPVALPIDELNQMELGERLDMSLPDGQYRVVLENRFEHDNGDVTWVGYLDGTDSGDRVIVTGGAGGSVGQVITPQSTYSIEFEAGQSWLVDVASRDVQYAMDSTDAGF